MKQKNLRINLYIRRKLASLAFGGNFQKTHLNRGEQPCTISHKLLGTYSHGTFVEVQDVRNGSLNGHYFNPRNIYVLEDVIVEPMQGLIYDLAGALLAESTVWPFYQLFFSFPWKPKRTLQVIDAGEIILISSSDYGHWVAQDLGPIVHLVSRFPLAKILISKNAPKFVKDFILILNREIIETSGPVQVKNLLIVAKSQDAGWMHPQDVVEIRNYGPFVSALSISQPERRIYASRRNCQRAPKNELQIESVFTKSGFEVVALDELDFLDEIKLLGQTKCLAGAHGSAHVNAIFMPSKTTVLDIVSENYWTELGARIVDIRAQNYLPIVSRGKPSDSVDLNLIRSAIAKI